MMAWIRFSQMGFLWFLLITNGQTEAGEFSKKLCNAVSKGIARFNRPPTVKPSSSGGNPTPTGAIKSLDVSEKFKLVQNPNGVSVVNKQNGGSYELLSGTGEMHVTNKMHFDTRRNDLTLVALGSEFAAFNKETGQWVDQNNKVKTFNIYSPIEQIELLSAPSVVRDAEREPGAVVVSGNRLITRQVLTEVSTSTGGEVRFEKPIQSIRLFDHYFHDRKLADHANAVAPKIEVQLQNDPRKFIYMIEGHLLFRSFGFSQKAVADFDPNKAQEIAALPDSPYRIYQFSNRAILYNENSEGNVVIGERKDNEPVHLAAGALANPRDSIIGVAIGSKLLIFDEATGEVRNTFDAGAPIKSLNLDITLSASGQGGNEIVHGAKVEVGKTEREFVVPQFDTDIKSTSVPTAISPAVPTQISFTQATPFALRDNAVIFTPATKIMMYVPGDLKTRLPSSGKFKEEGSIDVVEGGIRYGIVAGRDTQGDIMLIQYDKSSGQVNWVSFIVTSSHPFGSMRQIELGPNRKILIEYDPGNDKSGDVLQTDLHRGPEGGLGYGHLWDFPELRSISQSR
jgi:hypothetical protein